MLDNNNDRYLTKLIVNFNQLESNLMGLNLSEIKHHAVGALEFNSVSPCQIEITGVGSLRDAHKHLTNQDKCLEAMNSLAYGLTGHEPISICHIYGADIKKGGRRSSLHIADELIKLDKYYTAQEGRESDLTPNKLMLLVYIMHGCFLAMHDRPLIAEDVEAWACGPVIPELHRHIKGYGENAVTSIDCISEDECDLTETEREHIKRFYNAHGRYVEKYGRRVENDEAQLKERFCNKFSPWYKVEQRIHKAEKADSREEALKIPEDNLIPEEDIKAYFSLKFWPVANNVNYKLPNE